jgi:N-methylhydantoinase B
VRPEDGRHLGRCLFEREGSGGAGEHRGGFGLDYELELRRGAARASFVMDHGRFGPQGARGGVDGAVNEVTVFQDGEPYTPVHLSKEQDIPLTAGDRVRVKTPGGGGYGNPLDRDPKSVLRDVLLERYTTAQAAEMFGVVLSGLPLRVDTAETQQLRTGR